MKILVFKATRISENSDRVLIRVTSLDSFVHALPDEFITCQDGNNEDINVQKKELVDIEFSYLYHDFTTSMF